MSIHGQDENPIRSAAAAEARESAMLVIWSLLGMLLIVVFSLAFWA